MWNSKNKKIILIGSPGSGKSYFARELKEKLGYPITYLDCLYWQPNWVGTSRNEFIAKQETVMKEDSWIIDGNYSHTLELRVKACDVIFFFDYPVEVCLKAVRKRCGTKRDDLPGYLDENYDPEFEKYIRDFPLEMKPQIFELIAKYPDKNVIIFKSREDKDLFIKNM